MAYLLSFRVCVRSKVEGICVYVSEYEAMDSDKPIASENSQFLHFPDRFFSYEIINQINPLLIVQ